MRDWTIWIRKLHNSPKLGCELYVLRAGDRPGWDDHYVNTYNNVAEAQQFADKLLSAPRNTPVDVGYGVTLTLPN